jgi:hypothetical protein
MTDLRDTMVRKCTDAEFANAQRQLLEILNRVRDLDPEARARLNAVAHHAYTCQCPACREFWALMPPVPQLGDIP